MYSLQAQAMILSLKMLKTLEATDPWISKHDPYDNHDQDKDQKAEGIREGHRRAENTV